MAEATAGTESGCPGGGGAAAQPFVLGFGGTTRASSSGLRALRYCLQQIEKAGARTQLLAGADLELPMYAPERAERNARARTLVEAAGAADALLVASPGYHGSVSGLVKNALDYLEDLRDAEPPYLDGRAVGCIVTSDGRQSGTTTLVAIRSIVHALRAWPTPLGVVVDTSVPAFDEADAPLEIPLRVHLDTLADQVFRAADVRVRLRHGRL